MESSMEQQVQSSKTLDSINKLIEIMDLNSDDKKPNIPQIAIYLRPFVEDGNVDLILSRILTSKMMDEIRDALLSEESILSKSASYIIKSIISYLMVNKVARENLQQQQDDKSGGHHIFVHLKYNQFQGFWSLFFDLFDILNEKQFHLVEPFLIKMRKSMFVTREFVPWLAVIIKKCLQHDNRSVAREGLLIFINSGLSTETVGGGEDKLACVKCLQSTILPAVQKNIAWMLPESEDYFGCSQRFGKLVGLVCDEPVLTILSYLTETGSGFSPMAIYFLVRACKSCIKAKSDVLKFLTTVSQVLSCRLVNCDRFTKKQLQNLVIDIIIETHQVSISPEFHCSNFSTSLDDGRFSRLFHFLGLLDDDIFCKNSKMLSSLLYSLQNAAGDQQTEGFDKWVIQENYAESHKQILLNVKQSPVKCRGFFRWILLHALSNAGKSHVANFGSLFSFYIEKIVSVSDNKLSISGEDEIQNAILDFANNVGVHVRADEDGSKQQDLVPVLQFLFRYSLKTLYSLFQSSLSQIDFLVAISSFNLLESTKQWKQSELEILMDLSKLLINSEEEDSLSQVLLLKVLIQLQLLQPGEEQKKLAIIFSKICDLKLPTIDVDLSPALKNEFNSKVTDLKVWALLTHISGSLREDQMMMTKDFLDRMISTAMSFVDSGTHLTMISILEILQNVLVLGFRVGYDGVVSQIVSHVDELWKLILDLRATETFFEILPSFCDFICQPSFVGHSVLSKYSSKFFELSESIQGVAYILSLSLSKIDIKPLQTDVRFEPFLTELMTVNVTAACHGESVLKSTRTTFNIWDYLMKSENLDTNFNDQRINLPFCGNTKSRVIALLNIIRDYDIIKCHSKQKGDGYLDMVTETFLQFNEDDSVDGKRYFQGSYIHRYKQRIAQSLCILQPLLNLHASGNVLRRLLRSLGNDGPQASIRYITEWTIINILIKYSELHAEFFQIADECLLQRPGFGSILATMTMHSALNLPLEDKMSATFFFDASLECVSNLLMSQNFIVRIYGNIALHKIFENAQSRSLTDVITKYQVMYNSGKRAVETAAGNFVKIYNTIRNDFYFKCFSPIDHYYCDVILIYVPTLLRMVNDEVIHQRDLMSISSSFKLALPFFSPNDTRILYDGESENTWHIRNGIADGREHGEEASASFESSSNVGQGAILQVKSNPWKYLPIAEDIVDFPEEIQLKKRSMKDQLVVVASLIDCIPNLGGLCRTCEVFGVSKYVMSSMKFLEDPIFKNLSVSSQRWVDVLEVPVSQLQDFLKLYSTQGYTIVACEQALESKKLTTFTWPQKTVLLLGNEKFGVSSELLYLVDHCVEIPQCGLVRSLNVHVSGAICIYSYASQHLL